MDDVDKMPGAKPCPFCGGLPYLSREDLNGRVTFAAICASCAAQGPWVKVGESGEPPARRRAEKQWNTRVEAG
jgi:Lar family restriction alleviation protein